MEFVIIGFIFNCKALCCLYLISSRVYQRDVCIVIEDHGNNVLEQKEKDPGVLVSGPDVRIRATFGALLVISSSKTSIGSN